MKGINDPFKDLHRLLDKQNFKNEKEAKEFMDSLMGKPFPSISDEELTLEEKAQDLVYEAQELPLKEAKQKIEEALRMNPDCIEAYEFLGSRENNLDSAMSYYKKGVDTGKRLFGGKYLEEHKGHFWEFHGTRPFMRCMMHFADCLYSLGKKQESISIMEEMIDLNSNDNQGVRDQLMLYLLKQNEFDKFRKYLSMFPEDIGAAAIFNRTLHSFMTKGNNDNSLKLLKKAHNENKFVIPMLISSKETNKLPDKYGIGDKSEAYYYSFFAYRIWQQTLGAVQWVLKHRHHL